MAKHGLSSKTEKSNLILGHHFVLRVLGGLVSFVFVKVIDDS